MATTVEHAAFGNGNAVAFSDGKTAAHRLAALDALRGLAALGVVLLHFTTDFHRDLCPTRAASWSWPYGAYGVHLFFVISGFVILMTAEKAKAPRDFVVSRFSRLFPPYWAAIGITTTVLALFPVLGTPDLPHVLRRAAVDVTMVQSWFRIASIDSVYWTLQVELSFYLLLLALIWRKAIDYALPAMVVLVLVALVDHLLVTRPWGAAYAHLRMLLFLEHAYLFTAGMVIYKVRKKCEPVHLVILFLCALCPATANYAPNSPRFDTIASVALATIVYLAATGRIEWLAQRALVYLGSISYSLYLTHHMLGLTFLKRANEHGMHPDIALWLAIVLSLILASAMTHFVERPTLRWFRNRLGVTKR